MESKKDSDHIDSLLKKEIIATQKVSGGILPVEQKWTFYANGEVLHPNGNVSLLSDEQIIIIKNLFKTKEGFEYLDTLYSAPMGSADYSTMELQCFFDEKSKKIKIEDANSDIPDVFWELWEELQVAAEKSLKNQKKDKQ